MGCLVLFSTYKGFGTLSPGGNAFKADDSKGESNELLLASMVFASLSTSSSSKSVTSKATHSGP